MAYIKNSTDTNVVSVIPCWKNKHSVVLLHNT